MTDLDEILSAIDEFFGDTSRPASETREGLERIADYATCRAEIIESDSGANHDN